MKSIIQQEKECYFCGSTLNVEDHHIFFGHAMRAISEVQGFKCWLCAYHHRDNKHGVHGNRKLDRELRKACQAEYERRYSHSEWMAIVGRNYL